jgi:DNA-binding CsgD family transcriptional regulator/tetratricopeptide (TPR) repeat protein
MLDHLHKAREAYERRAWRDAHKAFLCADEAAPLGADDLERLATAAYLIGRDLEFDGLIERLHRVHAEAIDPEGAARCTFWLALSCLFRGDMGQANAWIARGHRLVQDRDCAERGYLLLLAAEQQLRSGHAGAACATATDATAIGERCHDADLTAAARHALGRAFIQEGRVPPGLKLLDETMLAVVAGELSPIMTGLMYCSVIEACCEVFELSRAREWTFALSRWCEEQSEMLAFTGTCLVHRAEILQFQGAWPEALAEARRACERRAQRARNPPGAALYQQAEIYRLRGECAQADDAYRNASGLGYEPQPGLALLRLAQGRTDAASAAIRRVLIATTDRLHRARFLPACLEIMLAAGDVEGACGVCRELQALAETFDTDVLRAVAAQAHGALALAQGDAPAAVVPLRRAFELWERLEAPYEVARVRMLIGQACRALGDDEAGALELGAARSVFGRLGAQLDLVRLDALLTPAPPPAGPLTVRELQVLRLIAVGQTNKRIAGELHLSERTIDRHVSKILDKLDVPSRAAATAYAFAHHIL